MFLQELSAKTHNEDVWAAGPNYWLVLDGASGLKENRLPMAMPDAAYFVRALKSQLESRLNDEACQSQSLEDVLAQSIQALHPDFDWIKKEDLPSCTVCLLRRNKNDFEYLILGDSPLYLGLKGQTLCIADPAVGRLDDTVIALMQELASKHSGSFLAQRSHPDVRALLLANRMQKNKTDGYAICDPSLDWKGRAIMGKVNAQDVKCAALMSDGFEQLRQFLQLDADAFLRHIQADPASCFEQLWTLQEQDADCLQLPRLKKRDDTTLLFLDFEDLHASNP